MADGILLPLDAKLSINLAKSITCGKGGGIKDLCVKLSKKTSGQTAKMLTENGDLGPAALWFGVASFITIDEQLQ